MVLPFPVFVVIIVNLLELGFIWELAVILGLLVDWRFRVDLEFEVVLEIDLVLEIRLILVSMFTLRFNTAVEFEVDVYDLSRLTNRKNRLVRDNLNIIFLCFKIITKILHLNHKQIQ